MQQEWRQAVQGWQTYSQELAQLGERLDARTGNGCWRCWPTAAVKSPSPASAPRGLRRAR